VSDLPPSTLPLRVMTFNTGNDFIQPMHLIGMLREYDADIIGLVELSPHNADALQENLQAEYPHRLLLGRRFDGKGLLSRYPIRQHQFFTLLTVRPYIEAGVMVGDREITVFLVHTTAPNYRQLEMSRSANIAAEIQSLVKRGHLDKPTIYMGDFNCVDLSPEYKLLKDAGLTDTFRAVGSGAGRTFPTRFQYLPVRMPLMVRIDYIFVTSHFRPISSRVGLGYGSDHLPVISEIAFLPENAGIDSA
jgi:endonuclease/exonuclease/phosphatase family metal-dependent hydrolase